MSGILEVMWTLRARAGTLAVRAKDASFQVIAVGALPMGFQQMLGLVAAKYLSAGLRGSGWAAFSASALSSFRAAIARCGLVRETAYDQHPCWAQSTRCSREVPPGVRSWLEQLTPNETVPGLLA